MSVNVFAWITFIYNFYITLQKYMVFYFIDYMENYEILREGIQIYII